MEHDLVVISYNTAVSDLGMLRMVLWDTVILDEAQNVKNFSSSRSIAVKKIPKRAGIAITGTPFENHLTDIWSLADFVLPDIWDQYRISKAAMGTMLTEHL